MRHFRFAAVLLLLAMTAAAEELYVPLSAHTELRIANRSPSRTSVSIELLGSRKTVKLDIEPGQTASWSNDTAGFGAARVSADAAVEMQAVSECLSCGSRVSVPVLASRDAVDDAAVPVRVQPAELPWRGGVLVVNPGEGTALVAATVHRGGEMADQSLLRIRGHAMRRIAFDATAGDRLSFRSPQPLLLFGYDSNERSGARVFTPVVNAVGGKRRSVRSISGPVTPPPPPPEPQTVVLTPSKDNTLYQSVSGTQSNGAGIHLFAGMTASRGVRRALLAFDVASQIPPGSRITKVTLTMFVSMTNAGPGPATLHRVSADWGEGTSNAGPSRDGDGASARTGDATWIHRFFPNQPWTTPGGDFTAEPDATTIVASAGTWESNEALVARVQEWLDQPATNFGWLVRATEGDDISAKRFDSSEIPAESRRPTLTVEFLR